MREIIYVQMHRCQGAVVRTLGLIERRGFSVVSIDALPPRRDSDLRMHIGVEAEARCFHTLTGQLNRLLDVKYASVDGARESHAQRMGL